MKTVSKRKKKGDKDKIDIALKYVIFATAVIQLVNTILEIVNKLT